MTRSEVSPLPCAGVGEGREHHQAVPRSASGFSDQLLSGEHRFCRLSSIDRVVHLPVLGLLPRSSSRCVSAILPCDLVFSVSLDSYVCWSIHAH
uniref:Uncharacterized protein n=1 Tax=Triticum urartu TaxID=4572 RepID=A0A8R7V4N0_TRIUA